MSYVSVAEAAKKIRLALKAAGINSRMVSVRSESYSMGSSINIEVRDLSVDIPLVKRLARGEEKVDRCPHTGEILSGGNRFVFVRLCNDALKVRAAALDPEKPVVNGFHIYPEGSKGEYYACRWPEGDYPKAASATVRGFSLTGVVGAALAYAADL